MKFACDRCHKRFSTADEPVPGRMYRIPCRCGNTVVLQLDAAAEPVRAAASIAPPRPPRPRTAPPPLPARAPAPRQGPAAPAVAPIVPATSAEEDPFAPARVERPDLRGLLARAAEEVTPTILTPTSARRDPDGAPGASIPYGPRAADPLATAVRRARTHALALGGAAGAIVGALSAAVLTMLVLRAPSPAAAPELPIAQPVAEATPPAAPAPREVAVRAPPAAAAPARRARAAEPASAGAATPAPAVAAASVAPARTPRAPAVPLTPRVPPAPERLETASAVEPEPLDARAVPDAAPAEAADGAARTAGSAPAVSDAAATATPASSEGRTSTEEPATDPATPGEGPAAPPEDPPAPDVGAPARAAEAHVAAGP